jgi:hypothetical protein
MEIELDDESLLISTRGGSAADAQSPDKRNALDAACAGVVDAVREAASTGRRRDSPGCQRERFLLRHGPHRGAETDPANLASPELLGRRGLQAHGVGGAGRGAAGGMGLALNAHMVSLVDARFG